MYDLLIIGQGIAGTLAGIEAIKKKLKILIIDDNQENASQVAAGLVEPISGQRFTLSINQETSLPFAKSYYELLEKQLKTNIIISRKTERYFTNQDQEKIVNKRLKDPGFAPYFGKKTPPPNHTNFKWGGIIINHSFSINTTKLLSTAKAYFKKENILFTETYDPTKLKIQKNNLKYKNILTKTILFCQGAQLEQNPLFTNLPFRSSKGDVLTLKLPHFKTNTNLSFEKWLIPIENNQFKYGATYEWPPYTNQPLESSKQTLLNHLKTFINSPVTVTNHQSGIRCALKTNHPICEAHPIYANIHVLGALGSKGFMHAPYLANQIIQKIHNLCYP